MKTNLKLVVIGGLLSALCCSAFAQGTAFTYQGRLNSGTNAANGSYDLTFALFAASSGGSVVAGPLTNSATGITNGLFTVTLDFGGGVFTGSARWLELGVRTNGSGSFTTLTPRQPILPTPYALYASNSATALTAGSAATAVNGVVTTGNYADPGWIASLSGSKISGNISGNAANITGTLSATQLSGTISLARLPGVVLTNNRSGVTLSGTFSGNGAGLTGVPGTITWQAVSGASQQAQPNTGYIVNNTAQVTITLPASPNVGDIVRVSGVGAGGWNLAQNDGQFILVGNATALSVGSTWTAQNSGNQNWQSVASSADGSKLVACVYGGQIYTSTDSGVTWTARDSSRNWESVASSADGSKLVACVYGGQIFTSTNSGVAWTPQDSSRNWSGVASSADGSKLVTCVNGGQIYTSTNSGVTWTAQNSDGGNWSVAASSADGSKLVACLSGGQIYTSVDSGTNWTAQNSGSWNWIAAASSADGSKLVACFSGGQIYTSTDSGVTWIPQNSGSLNWQAVASSADGSKLVAGVYGGQIYTSTDSGVTWIPQNSGSLNWKSVASSADGSKMAAGVYGGQIYTSAPALASPGSTTTAGSGGSLRGGLGASIELQYIGNNEFIILSYAGTIFGY